MGIADVDGFSFKMRVVQVHIKFQFYAPQSAQTISYSESLMA